MRWTRVVSRKSNLIGSNGASFVIGLGLGMDPRTEGSVRELKELYTKVDDLSHSLPSFEDESINLVPGFCALAELPRSRIAVPNQNGFSLCDDSEEANLQVNDSPLNNDDEHQFGVINQDGVEPIMLEAVPHCHRSDWFLKQNIDESKLCPNGGLGLALFVGYCEALGVQPQDVWADVVPFYAKSITHMGLGSHHEILLKAFLGVDLQILDSLSFECQAKNDAAWKPQRILEEDDLPFHIVRGARWKTMHLGAFSNFDPNVVPDPDSSEFVDFLKEQCAVDSRRREDKARQQRRREEIDRIIEETFCKDMKEYEESFQWIFDSQRLRFLSRVGEELTRRFNLAQDVAEYSHDDADRLQTHGEVAWRLRHFLHNQYFEELSRREQNPSEYSLPDSFGPPGGMHGMRAGTILAVSSELAKMDSPLGWWAWKALFNEAVLANKSGHSPHNIQFHLKDGKLSYKYAKQQPASYSNILDAVPRAHIAFHVIDRDNPVNERVMLLGPPEHYQLDTAKNQRTQRCVSGGKVVHLGLDRKAKDWKKAITTLKMTATGRSKFAMRLEEAIEERNRSHATNTRFALKNFAMKLRTNADCNYPRELWRAIGMDFAHHAEHAFIPQSESATIKVKELKQEMSPNKTAVC